MMESVYDLKPIYTNSVRVKLTDRKDRENDRYVEYDLAELHHMPMPMLESAIKHIKDHPERVGNLVADAFSYCTARLARLPSGLARAAYTLAAYPE